MTRKWTHVPGSAGSVGDMPFPNFEGKHTHDAFITPQDFLAWARRAGLETETELPPDALLIYQSSALKHLTETYGARAVSSLAGDVHVIDEPRPVVVARANGIGAPVAAVTLEELTACGVRRVINVGTAGTLSQHLAIGDIVVCTGAVRDEGTSYHYLSHDEPAAPSGALTEALAEAIIRQGRSVHRGRTWTIDAPYRETVEEARHYQTEGVATVDMEASAVFAVARVRGIEAAAAFSISDSLAELVWSPHFDSAETRAGLVAVLDAAIEAFA